MKTRTTSIPAHVRLEGRPIGRSGIAWRQLAAACCAAAVLAAVPAAARADYPDRAITIIVPIAAGGAADALSRLIGQKLQERVGQPVVIENKPGAAGVLGSKLVAHAKPDGYTLVMGSSALVVLQAVKPRNMTFDLLKDLAPVTQTALAPMVIASSVKAPFADLRGMVAYAKANPGKLSVGVSPGPGGTAHLTLERMKLEQGFEAVAVPYKGSSPATLAVLGGEVPVLIDAMSGVVQYITAGSMRGLASLTTHRVNPGIPTVAEAGYPGYAANSWNGLLAPAGTPPDVIAFLNREIGAILAQPDVTAKILEVGFVPPDETGPEPFARMMKQDIATWQRVVKEAKLNLDE